MSRKRTRGKAVAAGQRVDDIIRRAQQQPGIADLMALMEQSEELETLAREQREAAVATRVVSATATAG